MIKTTKFWLIVSLCFNLLFIGAFVGGASHGRNMAHKSPQAAPDEVFAVIRAMPKDDRKELINQFRQNAPRAQNGSLEAFASLIAANPYDAGAVARYFEQRGEYKNQRAKRAQKMLQEQIQKMDAKERADMAEKILTMPIRGGKRP